MDSKLVLQIVIGHVQSLKRSCCSCCWVEKKEIKMKGKIKETFTLYSLLTLSTGAYSERGERGGKRQRDGGKCRRLLESLPICRQQLLFFFFVFNFKLLLTCGLKTIEVGF